MGAGELLLADGTIATPAGHFPDNAADGDRYMAEQLSVRAADLRFVVDQLDRSDAVGLLAGRLDTEHIAAVGHSFGGATAVAVAALDPRIIAAVNIDGTLYGDPRPRAAAAVPAAGERSFGDRPFRAVSRAQSQPHSAPAGPRLPLRDRRGESLQLHRCAAVPRRTRTVGGRPVHRRCARTGGHPACGRRQRGRIPAGSAGRIARRCAGRRGAPPEHPRRAGALVASCPDPPRVSR